MCKERRARERIPVKVVGHCTRSKPGTGPPQHFVSFTKDMSADGARVVLAQDVSTGDTLTVALEIPTSFIPALVYSSVVWAQGVVVWGDTMHSFTEAGIKFLDMRPVDGEKILRFIALKSAAAKRALPDTEPQPRSALR